MTTNKYLPNFIYTHIIKENNMDVKLYALNQLLNLNHKKDK